MRRQCASTPAPAGLALLGFIEAGMAADQPEKLTKTVGETVSRAGATAVNDRVESRFATFPALPETCLEN